LEQSKSEILREWIKTKLDNNYDYSTKDNRTFDFKEFVNSYKEFDMKKDKPLYLYILKKEAKRRGIDPRTLGLKPHRRTFPEGDMTGTTTIAEAPVRKIPVVKEEKHELENTGNTESTMTQEQDNFTARSVGLVVKYSYNFLKLIDPFLEGLTQEEQNDFAELWHPAFERYLKSDRAMLVVPSLCTLFLLITKIKDAKQKAKNQNSDDEPDNQVKT
jgi:hypothetical protein